MLLASGTSLGNNNPIFKNNRSRNSFVGNSIEWCCILFLICLLYKLSLLGVGVLAVITMLGFSNKSVISFPFSSISVWTALYVVMATTTAFLVDPYEGAYRTAQCLLILSSGIVVAKHFSDLPRENADTFIRKLTFVGIGIFISVVIYHLSIHRYAGWKLFYDTKFVFSLLPFLFFLQEDAIRKRFGAFGWWLLICALAAILVVTGERKAYLLWTCLFFLSNGSRLGKSVILVAIAAALMLFMGLSSGDYVEQRLTSLFKSHRQATMEEMILDKDIGYKSDLIRTFVNRNARELFLSNPLFGLGATGYQGWATENFYSINPGLATNVHGEINRVPVEGGLVGIGVALAYLYCALRRVYAHIRAKGGLSIPSLDKLPLYLLMFVLMYTFTEALNTLMLEIILLYGFYLSSITPARYKSPIRPLSKTRIGF